MLTEAERAHIEDILLRERERVTDSMTQKEEEVQGALTDTGELTLYDQHPADVGTETYQQEQDMMLAQQLSRRQEEIDEALRRLRTEPERFGVCERCGKPIGMARLEVIPEARFCAECQELLESGAARASA